MSYKKHYFGTDNDGQRIYLDAPSWDCGWYWGFGYLGNSNCHYHLDGYQNGRNINMFDALKNDYTLCKELKHDGTLWVFCELVLTAYTLKKTAELYHIGGSHMTTNPCNELLRNEEQENHINKVLLPAIFDKIEYLFSEEYAQELKAKKEQKKQDDAKKENERLKKRALSDKIESEGIAWFESNGLDTDNVIFYSHKNQWCIGWRGKVRDSWVAQFKRSGPFPFDYKFK